MSKAKGNKDVQRGKDGRVLPGGGSLNPGGVPKRALEFRMAALDLVPEAMNQLREMLTSGDAEDRRFAIHEVNARGLGKHAAPAELPDDVQPLPAGDASPQALLGRTCSMYANVLGRLEAKAAAGAPMSEAEIASMREMAQTLATLAREEREIAKAGPGADLTDEALVAKVLGAVPLEKLQAALEARQ